MIMKQQLMFAVAFAALPFWSVMAQINISGSAEINVAPDEVYISAGVETRGAKLDEAARQNNEHVASVLAFLKDAGVPDKNIQTDSIQVQPEYGRPDSSIDTQFYQVRKSIGVKLGTITNLEPVLTGMLSHGVNRLNNVDFRSTELRKYRDQARALAIQAAKEKAVALCRELDVKCGKPTSINARESNGYFNWPVGRWGFGGNPMYMNSAQNVVQDAGGNSEITGEATAVGQIRISATVDVSFAIE